MREFYKLLSMKKKNVIGLMSGTSLDGVDAAIVEVCGYGVETSVNLLAFETVPFPADIPRRILSLCHPETGRVDAICEMNFTLGHLFAEAVKRILRKSGMSANDIALIGSHGQTIYHLPRVAGTAYSELGGNSTLQIGEPAVIAHETGIPTIADFRLADMAAGGQGAPLVAYPDYLLFRDRVKTVGLLNIGGIANLTVLPAGGSLETVFASDTGPGNMCVDAVVREMTGGKERYDTGGTRAAQGTPYQPLLETWLKHPFFQLPPPKTTGREMFGDTFALQCLTACRAQGLEDTDCVATLTELTVRTIADVIARCAAERTVIDRLYVSGGGVYNQTLMRRLGEEIAETPVAPLESAGLSSAAKEAVAFAILANETLHGQAGNLPSATGASVRKILGKLVSP